MEGRGTIFLGVIPFRDLVVARPNWGWWLLSIFFFLLKFLGLLLCYGQKILNSQAPLCLTILTITSDRNWWNTVLSLSHLALRMMHKHLNLTSKSNIREWPYEMGRKLLLHLEICGKLFVFAGQCSMTIVVLVAFCLWWHSRCKCQNFSVCPCLAWQTSWRSVVAQQD
jgi:hypothetical protein